MEEKSGIVTTLEHIEAKQIELNNLLLAQNEKIDLVLETVESYLSWVSEQIETLNGWNNGA